MIDLWIIYTYCKILIVAQPASPTVLQWEPNGLPRIHQLLHDPQEMTQLDVILAPEAPILRRKAISSKCQLNKYDFFLDLSSLGRKAENLKRSIRHLHDGQLRWRSEFSTCESCDHEYLLIRRVNFHKCEEQCGNHRGEMFKDVLLLSEVRQTYSVLGLDFQTFWVQSQQVGRVKGYEAVHDIGLYEGDEIKSILPINLVAKKPIQCWWIDGIQAERFNCKAFPVKHRYFLSLDKRYKYYSKLLYKWNVQFSLDTAYERMKLNLVTNLTFLNYQRRHMQISLIAPVSKDQLEADGQLSDCLCTRRKDRLALQRAASEVQSLAIAVQGLNLGLEAVRLKFVASADLSETSYLLSSQMDNKQRKKVDRFIKESDLNKLIINDSKVKPVSAEVDGLEVLLATLGQNRQVFKQLNAKNRRQVNQVDQVNQGIQERKPRALASGIASGLALSGRLVKIGLPYLLDRMSPILVEIKEKLEGRFIDMAHINKKIEMKDDINQYLSKVFGNTDMQFITRADRISVDSPGMASFEVNRTEISEELISSLAAATQKMVFFEENVKFLLPLALLSRLWPTLQHKIRKGSKVVTTFEDSQSFTKLTFYFEEIIPTSTVTHYKFHSLPASQLKGSFMTRLAEDVDIDLKSALSVSLNKGAVECSKRLISSVPQSLEACKKIETSPAVVEKSLRFQKTIQLYLVRGKANMHFECAGGGGGASVMTLEEQFNLLMIHDSCTLHVVFTTNSRPWARAAILNKDVGTDIFRSIDVLHLLKYNVPNEVSFATKMEHFMLGISISLGCLAIVVILVCFGVWKYKNKLKLRVKRVYQESPDLAIELQHSRRESRSSTRASAPRDTNPALEHERLMDRHDTHARTDRQTDRRKTEGAEGALNGEVLEAICTMSKPQHYSRSQLDGWARDAFPLPHLEGRETYATIRRARLHPEAISKV